MSTGYDWDGEEIQKLRTDKENLAIKVAVLEQEINATRQAQAAEIIRLQAELATAIKWRDAINDALTSWHNPVDEEETPKQAIDRLIGYETAWEKLSAADEVAAIKARSVKWAGIVGTLKAERDQLIGALQIAIERSGDLEPRPAWLDGACGLLNRGFLKVDHAALGDEPS